MKSASLLRVVLTLLSVLAIAQPVAAAPGDTIFTHPGKIVSVGGRGLKSRQHLPGDDRPFVCNRIFFRRMPDSIFSPALNAYIERVSKGQIPLWDEVISEEEQMPADERYLKTHIHRMGSKPLFVLTALEHFGDPLHLTAARRVKAKRFEEKNARAQARWLKLSSNSRQLFAPESGHYIEFEDPALVVRSVEAAVNEVRAGR